MAGHGFARTRWLRYTPRRSEAQPRQGDEPMSGHQANPNHPLRIATLDHVVLRCARLDATMAFYTDVLGCTLERELPELGLHQLRAGRGADRPRAHREQARGNGAPGCRAGQHGPLLPAHRRPRVGRACRASARARNRARAARNPLRRRRIRSVHLHHRPRGEHRRAQGRRRCAAPIDASREERTQSGPIPSMSGTIGRRRWPAGDASTNGPARTCCPQAARPDANRGLTPKRRSP